MQCHTSDTNKKFLECVSFCNFFFSDLFNFIFSRVLLLCRLILRFCLYYTHNNISGTLFPGYFSGMFLVSIPKEIIACNHNIPFLRLCFHYFVARWIFFRLSFATIIHILCAFDSIGFSLADFCANKCGFRRFCFEFVYFSWLLAAYANGSAIKILSTVDNTIAQPIIGFQHKRKTFYDVGVGAWQRRWRRHPFATTK